MKKIMYLVAAAAAVLTACADKDGFTVTIPTNPELNGEPAVLVNAFQGDTLATAVVTDGETKFSAKVGQPTLVLAMAKGLPIAQLVAEPGTVAVDTMGVAKGTPSNDAYAAFNDEIIAAGDSADVSTMALDFMTKNPANPYSAALFTNFGYMAPIELIDSITAHNEALATSPNIERLREQAKARANSTTGCQYIDFTLEQPDGKKVSLSQYLEGKKLTIVDFWASWCGPCRAEIPNLIALYNQYKAQGLQVVGVDVWERDGVEAGMKAATELGIPYPVMYNGTEEVTNLYGMNFIPTIIVIDSQGKIVARDITGKELADFVAANI